MPCDCWSCTSSRKHREATERGKLAVAACQGIGGHVADLLTYLAALDEQLQEAFMAWESECLDHGMLCVKIRDEAVNFVPGGGA